MNVTEKLLVLFVENLPVKMSRSNIFPPKPSQATQLPRGQGLVSRGSRVGEESNLTARLRDLLSLINYPSELRSRVVCVIYDLGFLKDSKLEEKN